MSAATHASVDAWRDLVDSPERREFAVAVRDHLAARFPSSVRRAVFDGEPLGDAWSEIAGAEYPLVGLPEDFGGLGTIVDVVALLEAAGGELIPAPLLATMAANQTLLASGLPIDGDPVDPAALAVVSGERRAARVDVASAYVLDGAAARRLVIVGSDSDGAFIGSVAIDGVEPTTVYTHVDAGRPVAVYDLGEVEVVAVEADIDALLANARIAVAADLTGIAAKALAMAVDHARTREQFGKRIGAFQGVKHRLADRYVAVERARSLTRAAAVAALGGTDVDVREYALLAKAAATDAAVDATRALVQVLAAMAMTSESDAHLFFRRAQQMAPFLGSASECYAAAARLRRADA